VLPPLLAHLNIRRPVLVGHSDGGTIALLHASRHPVTACVVMAPHVIVEDLSIAAITQAREAFRSGGLRERLARFHADVDGAFWQWNDIWLSEDFRAFDIRAQCRHITAPLLAIQGVDDPYGRWRRSTRSRPMRPIRACSSCRTAGIRRTRISRWPSTPRSESFWPIFRSMALPTQKKSIRSPFEADGPDIDQVGFLRARQDAAIDFESMQKSLKLNAALVHLIRLTPLLDAGVLKQFSRYKSQIECQRIVGCHLKHLPHGGWHSTHSDSKD
jgi:hypothetical protein